MDVSQGLRHMLAWHSVCPICSSRNPSSSGLCPACLRVLPRDDSDLTGPAVLDQLLAVWRYEPPLDAVIRRFKYFGQAYLARPLGLALAERVQKFDAPVRPETVIPVPMPYARLHKRGYNQAGELAFWVARELQLRWDPALAWRNDHQESLAGHSRAERQSLIPGAFSVSPEVAGLHVAVVDDVFTTGATVVELARELKDQDAASVSVWVAARTPPPGG